MLLQAKTGEPFEYEGRRIHVTPAPVTPGGPFVAWGGGSIAAARRAGRHGIGFFAQKGDPALGIAYEEASRQAGHEPGMCILSSVDSPTTVFVAENVDQAWEELGPYLMHDVLSYAEWNEGNADTASLSFVSTAEELRAGEPQSPHLQRGRGDRVRTRRSAPRPAPAHRRSATRSRLALSADGGRRGHAGSRHLTHGRVRRIESVDSWASTYRSCKRR